jgi:hypothetical protein
VGGIGNGAIQLLRERSEFGPGTIPKQLVDIIEQRDIRAERSQIAEKQSPIPFAG